MTDQTPGSPPPTRGELGYKILDRVLHALPDLRAWAAIGLFGLVVMIFLMIREKPALTENQGFMFLSQAVIVSGLVGSLLGYLFAAMPGASRPGGQPGTGAAAPPAGSMIIAPPAQVQLQQPATPPDPAEELFVPPKD